MNDTSIFRRPWTTDTADKFTVNPDPNQDSFSQPIDLNKLPGSIQMALPQPSMPFSQQTEGKPGIGQNIAQGFINSPLVQIAKNPSNIVPVAKQAVSGLANMTPESAAMGFMGGLESTEKSIEEMVLFHTKARSGSKNALWMDVDPAGYSSEIAAQQGGVQNKYKVNMGNKLKVEDTVDALKKLWPDKNSRPTIVNDYLKKGGFEQLGDDLSMQKLDIALTQRAKQVGYDTVHFLDRGHGGSEVLLLDPNKATKIDTRKEIYDSIGGKDVVFNLNGPKGKLIPSKIHQIGADGMIIIKPVDKKVENELGWLQVDANQLKKIIKKSGQVLPEAFQGFKDLTTKVLDRLKGKSFTSKQEIMDFTNMPELKQAERDLIRKVVGDEGNKINVSDFANKIHEQLLPLKRSEPLGQYNKQGGRYENIVLGSERGPIANYSEHIYQSPIKTSAGDVHFAGGSGRAINSGGAMQPNYFAHSRIEDLPIEKYKALTNVGLKPEITSKGGIRRVIELQSDLFQKGNLENENQFKYGPVNQVIPESEFKSRGLSQEAGLKHNAMAQKEADTLISDKSKLEPYRNTWHERVIREEVKQAAKDGKTKLQFPTGETAMKIEGLGDTNVFGEIIDGELSENAISIRDLKIGKEVARTDNLADESWIITDVLGDGKFKAVLADEIRQAMENGMSRAKALKELGNYSTAETFDISGKVDTENPIYKFYEKEVGRYLKNKYNAELITDPQGVKWWEVKVPKEKARMPVEAFALIPPLIPTKKKNENK